MTPGHPQWQCTIPEQLISFDQVHIWRIFLDVDNPATESLLAQLSTEEIVRANRFCFERDKKRFIATRGSVRRILGLYLQQSPQEIRFTYAANGKPLLKAGKNSAALRFNLSHSGTIALCAVTLHRNIGVDIEEIRTDIAVEQIASRFFSPNEISSLAQVQKTAMHKTFFRYWTRKEAVLKAAGYGLSFPMEKVDVSAINRDSMLPVPFPGDENANSDWYVQDLFPGDGYAAAVAVEKFGCELTYLHYSL